MFVRGVLRRRFGSVFMRWRHVAQELVGCEHRSNVDQIPEKSVLHAEDKHICAHHIECWLQGHTNLILLRNACIEMLSCKESFDC